MADTGRKKGNKDNKDRKDDVFARYRRRLVREGILNASLSGLSVGFITLIIAVVIFFCVDMAGLYWVAIIIWAAVSIASSLLFYFLRFRPDDRDVAERVDALGLEERMVTMDEYRMDNSFMASVQRDDAVKAAGSLQSKLLKIIVPAALICTIAITFVLGAGVTTYSALADNGIVPDINDIITKVEEIVSSVYYEVNYSCSGEGYIEGEETQTVREGEDAETVVAVPADNWAFVGWSDGLMTPERTDTEVSENISVTALFEELEEGDGDGFDEDEIDDDGMGEGDAESGDEQGEADDSDTTAGGGDELNNNIIDGDSDYHDFIDDAIDSASGTVNSDSNLSDREKDILGDYMGSL